MKTVHHISLAYPFTFTAVLKFILHLT